MRRSPHGQGVMSMSYDGGSSGGARGLLSCYAKAKPRPSKWDDAQRWLSSSSSRRAPDDDRRRSSCADDRTLLPSASQKATRQYSWREDAEATETKLVDAVLAYGQARCLSLRDVGTEMTPGGSKEPSRATTPRAAAAPAHEARGRTAPGARGSPRDRAASAREGGDGEAEEARKEAAAVSPATAWDAAERAKHMARYRREEMKIQAWENRRRQKAELQMKMTEAKAEKMKLRAQEKTATKLASTQAVAKERRARAEAKLNQRAARVGDKADLLRRTGHLSSSVFSLKLPMMCG
ncbi:hypothetical protein QOZ80_2BG0192100 [Eleusine coracana subsp. coracana]|nr:hypothetical protein QOZ80_2BG0192100 [Eleusine coracana subsp. coracana]